MSFCISRVSFLTTSLCSCVAIVEEATRFGSCRENNKSIVRKPVRLRCDCVPDSVHRVAFRGQCASQPKAAGYGVDQGRTTGWLWLDFAFRARQIKVIFELVFNGGRRQRWELVVFSDFCKERELANAGSILPSGARPGRDGRCCRRRGGGHHECRVRRRCNSVAAASPLQATAASCRTPR